MTKHKQEITAKRKLLLSVLDVGFSFCVDIAAGYCFLALAAQSTQTLTWNIIFSMVFLLLAILTRWYMHYYG